MEEIRPLDGKALSFGCASYLRSLTAWHTQILILIVSWLVITHAISEGEVDREEDVELITDTTSLSLLVVILAGISPKRSLLDNICSINCLCISFSFSSLKIKITTHVISLTTVIKQFKLNIKIKI